MTDLVRWEYRVQTIGTWLGTKDTDLETTLNAWGEEGWEALAVFQLENSAKIKIVAKRPLTSETRRRRNWPDFG